MPVDPRAHESTAAWSPIARDPRTGRPITVSALPAVELRAPPAPSEADFQAMLDDRAAAAAARRMAWVKAVVLVVGLAVTLSSVGLGVFRWAASRVRADVEREQSDARQVERLDAVEAGLGDVETVMRLERVERTQTQTMLRMLLTGQGQLPPEPADDVAAATARIDAILVE